MIPSSAKQVEKFIKEHFIKKLYSISSDFPLKDLKMLEEQLSEADQLVYVDDVHPQHNSKPSV